jgi:MFS family permease
VRTGLAFLPFALAITAGTVVARHLLAHVTPRAIAAAGLVLVAGFAVLLSTASAGSQYAADLLPGLVGLGLGVGMVFVPVSVTSMTGIPDSHAGVASGFLMTGHEIGAALGVAALTAVAGDLTTRAGIVTGTHDAFLAVAIGLVALLLPTALLPAHDPAAATAGHGHGHGH